MGSSPKPKKVKGDSAFSNTPIPPPAAYPSVLGSTNSSQVAGYRAQRAEGQGFSGTIGTSPEGLKTPPNTATVTLLGQ